MGNVFTDGFDPPDLSWVQDFAELACPPAVRLYEPSNGTEGDCFMSRWCWRCAKDNMNPETGDGDACEILGNAMALSVTDPDYPQEWRYGEDGKPTCTAFVLNVGQGHVDPEAVKRTQQAYDALPRDPVTGRPVIT